VIFPQKLHLISFRIMAAGKYDGKSNISNLGSGDSQYIYKFIPDEVEAFKKISSEVEFLPRSALTFKIYGKEFSLPRDKQFYGDVEENGIFPLYRYGGNYIPTVHKWSDTLSEMRSKVNNEMKQYCNHAVVNRYTCGNDHIGYHHDKEKDFVEGARVLTISLGIPRIFRLKNVKENTIQEIELQPGSLFILGPETNRLWKHTIVKQSNEKVDGVRISITLRLIKTKYDPISKKLIEETVTKSSKKKRKESEIDNSGDTSDEEKVKKEKDSKKQKLDTVNNENE